MGVCLRAPKPGMGTERGGCCSDHYKLGLDWDWTGDWQHMRRTKGASAVEDSTSCPAEPVAVWKRSSDPMVLIPLLLRHCSLA